MSEKTEKIKQKFLDELKNISDMQTLESIRVKYLGKSGLITSLLKDMKSLSQDERKTFGQVVNKLKGEAEKLMGEKMKKSEKCRFLIFQLLPIQKEVHTIPSRLFRESVRIYSSPWALRLRNTARL